MSKRLGRGLDALIPSLSVNDDDKVTEVSLQQLRPNPYQPRKNFDEQSIQELAESIKQHGVIQPIIVRSVVKGYEIIAGERRYRASQLLGLATIPAVIRTFSDQQVMEIALIENLQRENLNAIELALAYQGLMDQFSLTQEELSVKVGKSRSHIANFLRLLQLPEEVKEYVSRGTLSMGHARAIVGVKDTTKVKQLAKSTIEQGWSVRQLEEAIQQLHQKNKPAEKPKAVRHDPYLHEVEENLREQFRTTVRIKQNKDKGKIEIAYFSKQDLERLLELLQTVSSK
ncbi:ParB/RepB/Spo0J family partition protein [Paenibacillus thiaminolyticus]|uniref:ParB/RepB/Spo0J family partition protein n=1 Tax=Paenibacillus thiaminolyticus TaxID=49283 RepID=A0A3A3GH75_PANTH|nr:ParB/RepB/Spo0J family partition protein [Paenibacillus thiaminolyticus]RJG23711.1 ParB/RepB/Spo0J family partition protein [Paenibacillus thiaminolyticus]